MAGVEEFAALHRGGWVADVSEGVKPLLVNDEKVSAEGEEFEALVEQHLYGEEALGVYPLTTRKGLWFVDWVAVDLDDGDISSVHADNLVGVLQQFGITGWKEPSKSKGFHVWVYLTEPMLASTARNCMIGACRIVETPIDEVYPKQTQLGPGKIGNCLRLPYPQTRNPGRQEVEGYTWEQYTEAALASRSTPAQVEQLHGLYLATEPVKTATTYGNLEILDEDDLTGRARHIWDNPFELDRSKTLFRFAVSLLERDYSEQSVVTWVAKLDERVGKFVGRADAEKQIRNLVQSAMQTL